MSIPVLNPDYVTLLFADVSRLLGLVINHNDPTECLIIFQNNEDFFEVLKLVHPTKMMEPYGQRFEKTQYRTSVN